LFAGGLVVATAEASRWYRQFVLGALLSTPAFVYFVGNLIFHVRLLRLLEPMLVFSGLMVLAAPGIYWGRRYARRDKTFGRLALSMGLLFVALFLLVAFYGTRLGIIQKQEALRLAVRALIVTPLVMTISSYVLRILRGKRE